MRLRSLLAAAGIALSACGGSPDQPAAPALSSSKDLLTFAAGTQQIGAATIDPVTHTVTVHLSTNGHLGRLAPIFTASDRATVSPASGAVVNFSAGPVTFRVTAEDGSHQDWIVTVSKLAAYRRLFYAPGPDGVIGTADDLATFYTQYEYDAAHRLVAMHAMNAGADGLVDTADDVESQRDLVDCDAFGEPLLSRTYFQGADGVFGTADDLFTGLYTRYVTDAGGVQVRQELLNYGPDTTLGSADDPYRRYYVSAVDATGRVAGLRGYTAAGADGLWFTADDVVGYNIVFDLDSDGNQVAGHVYNGTGPDGVFGTADDVLSGWYTQVNW